VRRRGVRPAVLVDRDSELLRQHVRRRLPHHVRNELSDVHGPLRGDSDLSERHLRLQLRDWVSPLRKPVRCRRQRQQLRNELFGLPAGSAQHHADLHATHRDEPVRMRLELWRRYNPLQFAVCASRLHNCVRPILRGLLVDQFTRARDLQQRHLLHRLHHQLQWDVRQQPDERHQLRDLWHHLFRR